MQNTHTADTPQLKRSISLVQISLYGIGSILGAGIYVLLGEVTKASGYATPSAFLLAAIIVFFSAYSYSQLSRRFPLSAGEAVYIQEAFKQQLLSQLAGFAIILAGIVSAATLINGFIAYFGIFFQAPKTVLICMLVLLLFIITAWGVSESIMIAVLTTVIEIIGLAMIIGVTKEHWHSISLVAFLPEMNPDAIKGTLAGAFLAFYAFIGFEDMVNMAEEVKKPRINLPLSIFIALFFTLALYELTAIAALVSVPIDALSNSSTPLALIIETNSHIPAEVMAAISLIAILNGAMIQIIMASRVLYGMANKKLLFAVFARVNPKTQTPVLATVMVSILVLIFSLALPLVALAELTSGFILFVFCLVNFALFIICLREKIRNPVQLGIPLVGAISCAAFILFKLWHSYLL